MCLVVPCSQTENFGDGDRVSLSTLYEFVAERMLLNVRTRHYRCNVDFQKGLVKFLFTFYSGVGWRIWI